MISLRQIKYNLKKNRAIYYLNGLYKAKKIEQEWASLKHKYRGVKSSGAHTEYKYYKNKNKNNKKINVLWVGADYNQDNSGFLTALQHEFNVTVFVQKNGEYGQLFKDREGHPVVFNEAVRKSNSDRLKQYFANGNSFDVVIGQMWANYIDPKEIAKLTERGVFVINISMDDKFPDNWKKQNKEPLGAIGLAGAVDVTLTTTKEVVDWYRSHGYQAYYFPLATSENFQNLEIEKDIDVLFIGNKYGVREKVVRQLVSSGINIYCRGNGWEEGYATAQESISLSQRAKIVLGIGSVGYSDKLVTLKLRDFDGPMSGGVYITKYNPDLSELYNVDKEIILYRRYEEIPDLILKILEDWGKYKSVGLAGAKKAKQEHLWHHRIKFISGLIEDASKN